MDIPTATSFNELQKIFNVLKKSDEPKIHGNLLNLIYFILLFYINIL